MAYKTEDELREILRAACKKAGTQKAWAEQNGVSETYVCDILSSKRRVSDLIAGKLGYDKRFKPQTPRYEDI